MQPHHNVSIYAVLHQLSALEPMELSLSTHISLEEPVSLQTLNEDYPFIINMPVPGSGPCPWY